LAVVKRQKCSLHAQVQKVDGDFLFFQIKSQKATLWHLLFFYSSVDLLQQQKTFTGLVCNEFDFPERK